MQRLSPLFAGIALLALLALAFLGYRYLALRNAYEALESESAAKEDASLAAERTLAERLAEKTEEAIALEGALRIEQTKNGTFEAQIRELAGSVGTLTKLAETDPELLAKYSRVYFLNENYRPKALAPIAPDDTFQPERTYEIHAEVKPFLDDLLEAAKDEGLSLKVVSAHRSFETQAALKQGYQVRYGAGANAFSADQGYSEHQLGTTVDFTTPETGASFAGFDGTDEFAWLSKNAWRYGFILSYPAGNAYYQYEPWHYRFVGRALAERLEEDDQSFYDLDQRTIDGYLVNLFD